MSAYPSEDTEDASIEAEEISCEYSAQDLDGKVFRWVFPTNTDMLGGARAVMKAEEKPNGKLTIHVFDTTVEEGVRFTASFYMRQAAADLLMGVAEQSRSSCDFFAILSR
jgi:hypothetical protein